MMKLFTYSPSFFVIVLILIHVSLELLQQHSILVSGFTREDFPSNFVFGSGTSAGQVEGATFEDGRTLSIFDTWASSMTSAGDEHTRNVKCDQYHKYKEDVQLMVQTGLEAYRFSISWSRLIPNGRGPINPKGVEYYNNLINELVKNGIQPHVTLLHFDLPQALDDAYGGWGNEQFVKDFRDYADVCFQEYGDRVLHWTTFNEPNCYAAFSFNNKPPYVEVHNIMLAHASAARLYKDKYQATQHGLVGLNVCSAWYIPEGDNKEDLVATTRVTDFAIGWMIHPLVFGDYPDIMKQILGDELPSFTKQDIELLKGSFDFIGLNSYTTFSVKYNPLTVDITADCDTAEGVGGKSVQGALEYFKRVYGNPPVYIQETGFMTPRRSQEASLRDPSRIEYLSNSIESLLDAVRNGSNVKGYFTWSFLDLFELAGGFKNGYGLYYVDLNDTNLKRYPKLSALWYSAFLNGKRSFNPLRWKIASLDLPKQERRLSHLEKLNYTTTLKQNQNFMPMRLCLMGAMGGKIPSSNFESNVTLDKL